MPSPTPRRAARATGAGHGLETQSPTSPGGCPDPASGPALTVCATTNGAKPDNRTTDLGAWAYSYNIVARRFAPLLERLGQVVWLDRPESRMEFALQQARRHGRAPIALSFGPLPRLYPARTAPQVVYPFWEFPDLPDGPASGNWARLSRTVQLLLTASTFTADAFARAGVKPPIRVVPPPVPTGWFDRPFWNGPSPRTLAAPAHTLCPQSASAPSEDPDSQMPRRTLARRLADRCYRACRPLLRRRLAADLVELVQQRRRPPFTLPLEPEVQLSGVVYTMVLQPGPRKSWQELLSAFVWALGACPDATLVLRIVTRDQERPEALAALADYYRRLSGVSHQCRVVLLPEAMPDELMLRLADATTYYVNATLAEGACLPLQEMLAAGRPALSPVHSAMRDYFDADVGFVIASDREPCSLPGDDTGLLKTTWHRLNWESLHNQFQASYDLAKQPRAYAALAARARQRLHQWAGPEHVFILLKEALLPLAAQAAQPYAEPPWLKSAEEPRAEDQAA